MNSGLLDKAPRPVCNAQVEIDIDKFLAGLMLKLPEVIDIDLDLMMESISVLTSVLSPAPNILREIAFRTFCFSAYSGSNRGQTTLGSGSQWRKNGKVECAFSSLLLLLGWDQSVVKSV